MGDPQILAKRLQKRLLHTGPAHKLAGVHRLVFFGFKYLNIIIFLHFAAIAYLDKLQTPIDGLCFQVFLYSFMLLLIIFDLQVLQALHA